MKTLSITSILLISVALFVSCIGDDLHDDWRGGTVWVSTWPIQCLGNPWEQDWIDSHGGDPADYPADPNTAGLDPEEIEIIKNYYQSQDITIIDVKDADAGVGVCTACSCPAGYILYLKVYVADVGKMEELGYKKDMPSYK